MLADNLKVVPVLSSNPTAGTGGGLMATYLYQADESSAPSQLLAGGQYTNTDSYSILAINKAYFRNDSIQSVTGLVFAYNRSGFGFDLGDFDMPGGLPSIDIPQQGDIRFDVKVFSAGQMLMYEVKNNIFAGGYLAYASQNYSNFNEAGKIFQTLNGLENNSRGAFGINFAYDTRSKSEKYYPRDATFIQLIGSSFLKALGSDESYYSGVINARIYKRGFKANDVWANQFFGKYATKNAPDAGLAALGARGILRGFAVGQYKARYMSAFQTEYRYQIENTSFRLAAFAGIANLSGGSKGKIVEIPDIGKIESNRNSNNGNYYSGGIGVRYTLQKEAGVDFRVDFAYTSKDEAAIYAQINQSF